MFCVSSDYEIISLEKPELFEDTCLAVIWGKIELLLILK